MPSKKATSNSDTNECAFRWEGENELKLLLLTFGRRALPEEFEQLSTAFPGTTIGSIRNQISRQRARQRDLYDKLGWALPESAVSGGGRKAGVKNKATTPKKRGADEADDATPTKKARKGGARKGVVKEEKDTAVKEEMEKETLEGSSGNEEAVDTAEGVKEEEEEEV